MKTFWTVRADYGMAIKDYNTDDYDVAEARAKRELGERHFVSVEEATDDDLLWVSGMGGYLPVPARERVEELAKA